MKCFVAQLLANPWTRCTWLSYTGNEVWQKSWKSALLISYINVIRIREKKIVRRLIPQPGLRPKNSHGVLYFARFQLHLRNKIYKFKSFLVRRMSWGLNGTLVKDKMHTFKYCISNIIKFETTTILRLSYSTFVEMQGIKFLNKG